MRCTMPAILEKTPAAQVQVERQNPQLGALETLRRVGCTWLTQVAGLPPAASFRKLDPWLYTTQGRA